METMKRAISFFMALVLVLGMVPATALSAAAEEVETLPETVAEETTEAPAETEAEEELPAETEAEALPAETEEEMIPEETEFVEAVPEKTLPEEQAEEAYEEEPDEDDAAEPVPATGITLKASADRTYVGDEVKLTVSLDPKEADQEAFLLEVLDGNVDFVEDDVIIADDPGLVKIRAVCIDENGDPLLDAAGKEIEDTVEITFVDLRIQFNLLPIKEENEDLVIGESAIRLTSGQEVEVSLKYQTNETGSEEDWVTEYLLTPDVEWSMVPSESEAFATLSVSSANESVAILRAEHVTAVKQFTLRAVDAIAGEAELAVEICPGAEDLEIWLEDGNVTGETITVDLGKIERREEEILIPLMARLFPEGSVSKILWETSSDMIAGVELVSASDETALLSEEDEEEPDGIYVLVHVGGERLEGKATLTATCKDDPSIKATVTIETIDCLQADEIDWHSDTKKVEYLIAGKSVKLKALDITDPDNKKLLTSKQVKWSLGEEDYAYATISQDGTLAARNVVAGKEITVYCSVIGNEEDACLVKTVRIHPKAQAVHLMDGNDEECTGETLYVNTAGENKPENFTLGFWVEPTYDDGPAPAMLLSSGDELGALQEVTWKSSNTTIAKISSKTGEIRWQGKNGTVTITATAADGSGKSASVKIKFGKFAEVVDIECPLSFVRSGESVTMSRTTDASGAKLTWSLDEGDEKYASISTGGKLTVKSIYEEREITVTAVAEGTGASDSATVLLKPAKDGILTLYADGECVTKTTQKLDVATKTIVLTASVVGEGTEAVKWTFPTATVEMQYDDGNGTAEFAMKKTGTATVKATSLATGKTATVTLKGVRKAETVDIIEKEDMTLSAGQSMTLKVKLYDAEGKTPSSTAVRWSVEGDGEDFVTVSSGGKLTVSSSFKGEPADVTVTAVATDGSDAEDSCVVTIYPKATGVMIQYNDVSRVTLAYEIAQPGDEEFLLTALVYPVDQAKGDVKWSSSSTKIATVDADGLVTCKGTGTVTIKATAKDGSGKYASLKLTITKPVYEISFDENRDVLAGGKSLTLKPAILAADGKKPSNSAVTWSITGDTAYVSSFKNGTLKTKKVTEYKEVTVTATAKDGSGVSGSWTVGIYPATTSVQILDNLGAEVGSRTLYMRVGDVMALDAVSYPNSSTIRAAQAWTWSVSSKSKAIVSEDGVVEALAAGTVTVKATAKDGTGKYDSVKIKILN